VPGSRRCSSFEADSSEAVQTLAVVIIAHVDTGPLWYQWIARAGHHAWLWYGTDALAGAERLVQETSPDVLLVDVTSVTDPGWVQVQSLRQRFPYAKLPVVVVAADTRLTPGPHVHLVSAIESADELLKAVEAASRDNGDDGDNGTSFTTEKRRNGVF
jgi:CheY-like chemotaxis protein